MASISLITNYTTLKAAIADWLNRTDLTTQIPVFIQLLESSLKRRIRTKHRTQTEVDTVEDNGEVTIAANVENFELYITAPEASAGPIKPVSPGELYRYRSRYTGRANRPLYGAIIDTKLMLAPIPDDVYTVEITGERVFVELGDGQATNYIMDEYPDVYLWGALVAAEPYLKNESRMPVWKTQLEEAMNELEVALERNAWPSTPVAPSPMNFAQMNMIPGR